MKKSLLLLVFVCVGLIGCATITAPTPEEISNAYYGQYPENYEQLIKGAFSRSLFDPYSAYYIFEGKPLQGYVTVASVEGGNTEYGWRGFFLVNAKNRLGGYVGNKRYFYLIRDGRIIDIRDATSVGGR